MKAMPTTKTGSRSGTVPMAITKTTTAFAASAPKDLIDEGTNGKLTQVSLSTVEGLKLTQTVDIGWKGANGGGARLDCL